MHLKKKKIINLSAFISFAAVVVAHIMHRVWPFGYVDRSQKA